MTTTDLKAEYVAACEALKGLAQLIVAADAARYDAPPGAVYGKGTDGDMAGVANPTLDTVLDARRLGLSDEIRDLSGWLRTTAHSLHVRKERLDRALARWEGDVPKAA